MDSEWCCAHGGSYCTIVYAGQCRLAGHIVKRQRCPSCQVVVRSGLGPGQEAGDEGLGGGVHGDREPQPVGEDLIEELRPRPCGGGGGGGGGLTPPWGSRWCLDRKRRAGQWDGPETILVHFITVVSLLHLDRRFGVEKLRLKWARVISSPHKIDL